MSGKMYFFEKIFSTENSRDFSVMQHHDVVKTIDAFITPTPFFYGESFIVPWNLLTFCGRGSVRQSMPFITRLENTLEGNSVIFVVREDASQAVVLFLFLVNSIFCLKRKAPKIMYCKVAHPCIKVEVFWTVSCFAEAMKGMTVLPEGCILEPLPSELAGVEFLGNFSFWCLYK